MLGVNNNIGGLRAQDAMAFSNAKFQVALERLSTGVRINRAEDDAAGLLLRDRFSAQAKGLEEALINIQTAQGMIQVAEEGLNRVTEALQQMRQLAVRAADDNLTDEDRSSIQQQVRSLLKEVNDRAEKTRYNGHRLLDGSITDAVDERKAGAEIMTNALMRNGRELVDIGLAHPTYATTYGAVSQGSYEVKLVYSDERRASASNTSTLSGYINANDTGSTGPLPNNTILQTVYDREGNAHTATVTFSSTSANHWTYQVNIEAGGSFDEAVAVSGTFTTNDGIADASEHGEFNDNSITLSAGGAGVHTSAAQSFADTNTGSITLAIKDGTAAGQALSIDFSQVEENGNTSISSNLPAMTIAPAAVPGEAQTGNDNFSGNLNFSAPVGYAIDTASRTWVDRTGHTHNVTFTLSKVTAGDGVTTGDTWKYTVNGLSQSGVWTGSNSGSQDILVTFDAAGAVETVNGVSGNTATVTVGDGTVAGQAVVVDLATLTNVAGGAPGGSAVAGGDTTAVPPPSTDIEAAAGSFLDGDDLVGVTPPFTTASFNVQDSGGNNHSISYTFTKTAADTWSYAINGLTDTTGTWTGTATGASTGTIIFDPTTSLVSSINGAAPGTIPLTIGDTGGDYAMNVDFFTNLTEIYSNPLVVDPAQTPDGQAGDPTTSIQTTANTRLFSGAGPHTLSLGDVIDRTGMHAVGGGLVTFTQVGDTNQWQYQFKAPTDSSFTGAIVSGGSGTVEFNDWGELITNDPTQPTTFNVTFADGTAEGQTISMVFDANITMSRESDLRRTETNGGNGAGDPQVDAVIYWTDGGAPPTIVSTLEGVSESAKAYTGGGVMLTVNTVSRSDAGLVAYVKALQYVTATTEDKALQFQTGSDEGEVFRVGIQAMTVDKIFRGDFFQGDDVEGSISLGTHLQAEDLIGQLDDALSIVGGAQVKVGSFKNELDRTLELQRTHHTQMMSAFSNINDADMAMEATDQSKRNILMQSATAMIAQANTSAQFVLQLLR